MWRRNACARKRTMWSSTAWSLAGGASVSDDIISQKLSTEGADPLTLAGVNDGNLVELARLGGVKVALRGDLMTISGPTDFVSRAVGIANRMIEAARQRRDLTPDD